MLTPSQATKNLYWGSKVVNGQVRLVRQAPEKSNLLATLPGSIFPSYAFSQTTHQQTRAVDRRACYTTTLYSPRVRCSLLTRSCSLQPGTCCACLYPEFKKAATPEYQQEDHLAESSTGSLSLSTHHRIAAELWLCSASSVRLRHLFTLSLGRATRFWKSLGAD